MKTIKIKNFRIGIQPSSAASINMAFEIQKQRNAFLIQNANGQDTSTTYVLGDLHGNAMKLLIFLGVTGHLKPAERQYKSLLNRYNKKQHLQFMDLLDELIFEPSFAKLILIGDTLADRGKSDFMTLMIYKRMHENNIDFSVILSNHDSFPLASYLTDNEFKGKFTIDPCYSWDYANLPGAEKIKFSQAYRDNYLPHLKFMASDTVGEVTIIYSHAPFSKSIFNKAVKSIQEIGENAPDEGEEQVDKVIQQSFENHGLLEIARAVLNVQDFPLTTQSIDQINVTFNKLISIRSHALGSALTKPDSPLYEFIWTRGKLKNGLIDIQHHVPEGFYNIYGHTGEGHLLEKFGAVENLAIEKRCCLDSKMGMENDSSKLLICKISASISDEQKTALLKTAVQAAAAAYKEWYDENKGTSTTIGFFNRHGADGQRRVETLASVVERANTHKQIYGVLAKFANGHISRDNNGRQIGGTPNSNKHSFLAFFLSALKGYTPLSVMLGVLNTAIDFHSDTKEAANIRACALSKMRSLASEWPRVEDASINNSDLEQQNLLAIRNGKHSKVLKKHEQ